MGTNKEGQVRRQLLNAENALTNILLDFREVGDVSVHIEEEFEGE